MTAFNLMQMLAAQKTKAAEPIPALPEVQEVQLESAQAEPERQQPNANEHAERIGNIDIPMMLQHALPTGDDALRIVERKQASAEIVQKPMFSLKGMLLAQQKKFQEQFEETPTESTKATIQEEDTTNDGSRTSGATGALGENTPSRSGTQSETDRRIAGSNNAVTGLVFDPSQEAALEGLITQQFACLIGAAGTGKTTIENEFLKRTEHQYQTLRHRAKDEGDADTYTYNFCCIAFTGRAVEQMKRNLDAKYHNVCGTIHGPVCLAFIPEYYEDIDLATGIYKTKMRFIPTFNETNKLSYDLFLIDEAGMLGTDLYNQLRAAMKSTAKIILIGDINQLTPVFGRSVLGFAMAKWPVYELTTIHRQAQGNPIIANAHRILAGDMPIPVKGKFDMIELGPLVGSSEAFKTTMGAIQKLHKLNSFDPFEDGFIVPENNKALGQNTFNEMLCTYFNPYDHATPEAKRMIIQTGIGTFAAKVGDKVMVTANDRNANLTNGQIGRITHIALNSQYEGKVGLSQMDIEKMASVEVPADFNLEDMQNMDVAEKATTQYERQASHLVYVDFGNAKEVAELKNRIASVEQHIDRLTKEQLATRSSEDYNLLQQALVDLRNTKEKLEHELSQVSKEILFSKAGDFNKLKHAYAITVHKSQGGEYPTVVILIHSANFKGLCRELLYTAVTRARVRVVLLYNLKGMRIALRNQRIVGKTKEEKIASFIRVEQEALQNDNAVLPRLPEARLL